MDEEPRKIKVPVMDKRRAARALDEEQTTQQEARATLEAEEPAAAEAEAPDDVVEGELVASEPEHDYLEDLRRLQAEFDNYRKRMIKEQTAMAGRASARLVERLLPVLDSFDAAMTHGEVDAGIELAGKELKKVLENEGLDEIPADEGASFDPRVHEAFQAIDDPEVDEPIVRSKFRPGYRMGDQILRPAMVTVARPAEDTAEEDPAAETTAGETPADERRAAEE